MSTAAYAFTLECIGRGDGVIAAAATVAAAIEEAPPLNEWID